MGLIKWASSTSGDWLNAGDWGGAVPTATDDVQIEIPGVTVTVSTNVSLTASSITTSLSAFSVTGGGLTIGRDALFGGAFSMSGGAFGVYGAFTAQTDFTVSGTGALYLNGGSTVLNGNALQTGGLIQMGNGQMRSNGIFTEAGGVLKLYYSGGVFNALNLSSGSIQSYAPTLQVNGAYNQTGGTLSTLGRGVTLAGSFSQTGTASVINIQSGELITTGNGTLGGTISGAGTLHVQSGTTTLASGVVISLPVVSLTSGKLAIGGDLTLAKTFSMTGGTASELALKGHTLTVSGVSSLGGDLVGPGTYTANGGGQINGLSIDGSAVLNVSSVMNVSGGFTIGSSYGSRATLNIVSAKARLSIAGNFIINDASLNGQINNTGYLTKSGGSGTAIIYANVTSTAAIDVNIGTLSFSGASNSFGGVIAGLGTFELAAGQAAFAKGLSLTVGRVLLGGPSEQLKLSASLTYGGEWSQLGGTLWLNGATTTLTTTGRLNLDGGLVTGSGALTAAAGSRVNLSGATIDGTATLNVAGTAFQTSNVAAGDQIGADVTINIATGAVWNLEANSSLGGVAGSPAAENATINNSGTLQKLNGSANSNIAATLNNTGTLAVNSSSLSLYGNGTLGGVLTGGGTIDLDGTYTLASGVVLSVGRLGIGGIGSVSLAASAATAGGLSQDSGTLAVGNATLTVGGLTSLEGGTLSAQFGQTGALVTTGTLTLGDNYAVSYASLVVSGHADQIGDISVSDYIPGIGQQSGGVSPASAASLVIRAGATYQVDDNVGITGNGTLAVAGTMSFAGSGASIIGPMVIDTGTILGNSANLTFQGPITGTGVLQVGDGGSLAFNGLVSASDTISFTTGTGGLYLTDTPQFAAEIAGFSGGDFIEMTGISNTVATDKLSLDGTGRIVTITDVSQASLSLTFTTPQVLGSLSLEIGPHGGLALFHT